MKHTKLTLKHTPNISITAETRFDMCVTIQVVLAMPDREETASFLQVANANGFIYRLLHHVQKPDLIMPVSIYQLILGPKPSPELFPLETQEGSSQRQPLEHCSHVHRSENTFAGFSI